MKQQPHIAHIIYYLGVGGLENGLINLINNMPQDRYRHTIICLTEYTDFSQRISRDDVDIHALHMKQGKDFSVYIRLYKLLRKLKPTLVHTRNLAALETQFIAKLAGVSGRVHGEHGRDVFDLHGSNRKYKLLRKMMRYFVHQYIAVSRDLEKWLTDTINVSAQRVTQIYNGVDTGRFCPRKGLRLPVGPDGFITEDCLVIGTVGRMAEVKDQVTLASAFIHLVEMLPAMRSRLRLVIIGDGPLREQAMSLLRDAGMEELAWLPGERDDIPNMLRVMDIFVLPSLGEGISNTILEAMSTGLPVVATSVGGNSELVDEGRTGRLVPPSQPIKMAEALRNYVEQPELITLHGKAGRARVESDFSISSMVDGYTKVYDAVMQAHGPVS